MDLNSHCVTLGQARHADPFTAAQRAALQARSQLPASETPGWALTFAGGQHDPKRLLSGLRAVLGDIPIVGGCVAGVITAAAATLTGYECGLLLFPASLNPVNLFVVDGLEQDEAVSWSPTGRNFAEDSPVRYYCSAVLRFSTQQPTAYTACRQPFDGRLI
jgi:hypothetical protein